LALLLLGIAGEILLRVGPGGGSEGSASVRQSRLSRTIYAPDPELGALLVPWLRDTVVTPDFTYTLQTDHAGFANPEPWPNHVDVAVLGDSLLIGTGVGLDGEFTTLLAHRLGGPTVLNFGLSGAGTEHDYRVHRRYVAPLRPDLVIAILWVVWDIDNSLKFDHWRIEKTDKDYTEYRMTYGATHPSGGQAEGGGLNRIWSFLKGQLSKSHLVRAGYAGVRSLLGADQTVEQVTFPNGEILYLSTREQKRLAKGLTRPGTPNLREIFFRPLERLRTEVEAYGGRFVTVLVPSKEELYAAEAYPTVLRTVQEVKSDLASRGLPVLDLYPAFRERGRVSPVFYRADMHLNELGNQIVADEIGKWIVDEKIFASPFTAVNGARRSAE
jgi:lysophospholipase L1-like esterase